ncbi:peptidylprolyl isomerase [Nonomuraea sp. NEAU-A123]|uniref:peptidylprolyl isomerase n=1 Tax=Nonomuraea sp. NEAU-A123 TaxID=2839649 RepID=UPI001BE49091|nr:peptidylprolyl isomerase [Nonomuraea sp. NEAU-A123]MBT2229693.1 peptidylprolyl isomerase [Nonomuraea sp. NEAU-A123]
MSGEDRQSQLAREHKERQEQRAAADTAKARRNIFIGAGLAVVVVAGGIYAATTLVGKDDSAAKVSAESSPSASTSAAPLPTPSLSSLPKKAGKVTCTYKRETADVPMKYVGMPGSKPNLKLKTMTVFTNHGKIVIDVDPAATPCSVNSMDFLAKKNFYNNTKCHRLVTPETAGVFLLQCGDPKAKADGKNPTDGQGTAGYVFGDEAAGAIPYTRGVVFLTQPQDAAGQNSSQFAISLSDENAQIEGQYSVLGMVRSGLEIIEKVAKDGVIVSNDDITGDGGSTAPKNPIIIEKVTVS